MSTAPTTDNPYVMPASFAERTDQLFRELKRAIQFDRPAILLAVYRSEFVRQDVETQLTNQLRELGQHTLDIQISENNSDIPTLLVNHPQKEKIVFFLRGLRWGGGEDGRNAYRALNIRREYLVDERIRLILWLTESELQNLAWFATDFWVFRHRTVEFVDTPEVQQIQKHTFDLIWQDWNDYTFQENTASKIALREQLLAEMPSNQETEAARAQLLYNLAPLYSVQGEQQKAIATFHKALDLAAKTRNFQLQALAYNGLGNVYQDSGRTDEAITAYQKAIELDPKLAHPWNGLGNVYQNSGHTDEAIAAYQKAIDLDPKYAYPWNGLGNVYQNSGRTEEAAIAYKKSIELDPQFSHPWNGLGGVYQNSGRTEEAIAAYQKAIELDPRDADLWNNLGNAYQHSGRTEEAITAYQKAIELNPKSVHFWNSLGLTYRLSNNIEEATVAYQQALELNPNDTSAHACLAACYRQLGREEAYQTEIALARQYIMAQEDEYNRACIEAIAGNAEEALALLKIALEKQQTDPTWAQRDPDFALIRDNPRFQALFKG